jgi:tetratricopeptide (TPR) repeat protein
MSFVSCSSLVESTRKSLLGDTSPRSNTKKQVKWVSKSQYDDLMMKYKTLSEKYENLKEEKIANSSAFNQLDELASKKVDETVDVFGDKGIVKQNNTMTPPPVVKPLPPKKQSVSIDRVEQELTYYKKAVAVFDNGKIEEALKMFQSLEQSSHKQIRVRSKKYIGDIYFSKTKYDLALQVYENIINNDSYSGKVIPVLRTAAICSGKLGLNEKKAQYESILRDFFEVQL